jgi:hypothetical protein
MKFFMEGTNNKVPIENVRSIDIYQSYSCQKYNSFVYSSNTPEYDRNNFYTSYGVVITQINITYTLHNWTV